MPLTPFAFLFYGVLWIVLFVFVVIVINAVAYLLDNRRRRRESYRRWRGVALLLLPLLLLAGCASNDPNAVLNEIDNAAAIAETSVVLFTDPGPRQDALIAQIEKARQLSDLPALRRIISQFNGNPATRPVAPVH